uniref:hybrid sensor histidine kinase/response regulator n=1 Tax=Pararhizobium sp. IMCC3301 TaxID=3067904 RepID=UPI00274118F2|nr:ATP-binding protein [Pararhizobium sp. IMCC3301]
MDDLIAEFLTESNESLDMIDAGLVKFEHNPDNAELLHNIFRLVHTLKGTCGFLDLPRLEALSHAAETLMEGLRDDMPPAADLVTLILKSVDRIKLLLAQIEASDGTEPAGDDSTLIAELEHRAGRNDHVSEGADWSEATRQGEGGERPATALVTAPPHAQANERPSPRTVRVNAETLEHLRQSTAELFASRAQLLEIARRSDDYELKLAVQRLADLATGLQKTVVDTLMQPVRTAWQSLPRLVRDLELRLDKDIELVLQGGDMEVDRRIVDLIRDPLLHMVRNCADHGLETRENRIAAGKAPLGTICLSARCDDGNLVIEVLDDGQGLNSAKIRQKTVGAGLTADAEFNDMTVAERANLIFHSGFSTADSVSSVSGRGIGLDVVRHAIESAGGSIEVQSAPGEGTMFVMRVPLQPTAFQPGPMTREHGPGENKNEFRDRSGNSVRPQSSHVHTSRAMNLLFVGDSRFFSDMLVPVMEAAGYNVTVARNIPQAVANLRDGVHYRGIVMDLNIPENDRIQFTKMVQGRPHAAGIACIAVSSLATPEIVAAARASGFDACLAKSDRKGLLSCLDRIVKGAGIAA